MCQCHGEDTGKKSRARATMKALFSRFYFLNVEIVHVERGTDVTENHLRMRASEK